MPDCFLMQRSGKTLPDVADGGDYAGEQILSEKTVRLFLSSKSPNSGEASALTNPIWKIPAIAQHAAKRMQKP